MVESEVMTRYQITMTKIANVRKIISHQKTTEYVGNKYKIVNGTVIKVITTKKKKVP